MSSLARVVSELARILHRLARHLLKRDKWAASLAADRRARRRRCSWTGILGVNEPSITDPVCRAAVGAAADRIREVLLGAAVSVSR